MKILRNISAITLLFYIVLAFSGEAFANNPEPDCAGNYGLFPRELPRPESGWEKRNAAAFVEKIIAKAEGNAETEHLVARYFAQGYGVEQDFKTAAEWEQKAIAHGAPAEAQYCLAYAFEHGLGVTKDEAQAAALYQKAAERSQQYAQLRLAVMYSEGRGVPKSQSEAAKWCELGLGMPEPTPENPLYETWKKCDALRSAMPPDVIARLKERETELSDKANKYQMSQCPPTSQIKVVELQTTPRKDGQHRKSDEPYKLYVPLAYLNSSGREYNNISLLSIEAAYDDLQPACTKSEHPYQGLSDRKRLSLFLTRGNGAENIIAFNTDQMKKTSIWRKENLSEYPNYDHYFNFASKSEWWDDFFIPKKNELGVPYYVDCMKRSGRGETLCRLNADYKGEFFVQSSFSVERLKNIPEIYQKANQLMDQLSLPPEGAK